MEKNYRETLNERLHDPAFAAEWAALWPEGQLVYVTYYERYHGATPATRRITSCLSRKIRKHQKNNLTGQ